jgi:hypothetical protein
MQFYIVLGAAFVALLGPVIAAAIWANRRPKG